MRAAVAFVLSFVASTLAYTIITPNSVNGWKTTGGQPFTWSMVATDPANFSVVLTNQNQNSGIAPNYSQSLLALVNGSDLSAIAYPPAEEFSPALGYRLDFVSIPTQANNQNAQILAQSDEFNITDGSSSISASGTTGTGTSTPSTEPTQTGTSDTSGDSGTSAPSGISASILPSSSSTSGATSSYLVQTGLLVLSSLLGFTLT